MNNKLPRAVAVVSLAIGAHVAKAQEPASENRTGTQSSALLEEVVVSARKRAAGTAVQDTPIAVTAFSENQFEATFSDTLEDLGFLVPNVELKASSQIGNQNFTIRGMGVSGTTPSDSPAVGVFQNGVFWGVNYGALLDTFDIESIEILRGPQGTLFGRNVTGGAVLVNTKRPTDEFGFEVQGTVGNYGRRDLSLGISGPLGGGLKGRFAYLSRDEDGFFSNVAQNGADFGEMETELFRGTLMFSRPDSPIEATLIAEKYETDGDSVAAKGVEVEGNLPYQAGFRELDDWWDISIDNPGRAAVKVDSLTGIIRWDIGHGQITSITGWRDLSVDNHTDFDGAPISTFNQSVGLSQDQVTQEIRYASTFSERFDFTIGAYYFGQQQEYKEGRDLAFGSLQFASANALEQDAVSVFGEVDYALSDSLTLTVGGRYSQEEISAQTVPFGACPLNEDLPSPIRIRDLSLPCDLGPTDSEDWNDFSPKVGLSWTPTLNSLYYVSYTRGFRSGGFSLRGNNLLPPFDAETVDAFEAGTKQEFLDGRFRVNLAVFYNEFDDLQRTIFVPDPDAGAVQSTGNAASASISGLELEGTWQIVEGLVLTLAYGYTDASFDEFNGFDVDGDGTPDPELAEDLDFVRVPENSLSASVNYEHRLAGGSSLSFRSAVSYTDEQYFDDRNNILEPDYTLVDASVVWTSATEQWKAAIFGRNLFEEEYAYWGADLGALGSNRFLGAPRTYGMQLTYEY